MGRILSRDNGGYYLTVFGTPRGPPKPPPGPPKPAREGGPGGTPGGPPKKLSSLFRKKKCTKPLFCTIILAKSGVKQSLIRRQDPGFGGPPGGVPGGGSRGVRTGGSPRVPGGQKRVKNPVFREIGENGQKTLSGPRKSAKKGQKGPPVRTTSALNPKKGRKTPIFLSKNPKFASFFDFDAFSTF